MYEDIEEITNSIKTHVSFESVSSTGFHELRCHICNDRKKRAGFRFEEDKIIYHCFRGKCGFAVVQESGKHLTRKFKRLMEAYGVELPVHIRLRKKTPEKATQSELDPDKYIPHHYDPMEFDPEIVPINKLHPTNAYPLLEYIKKRRAEHYTFYSARTGYWKNRLIIPFYLYNNLIGWQAIDIFRNRFEIHSKSGELLFFSTGTIPKNPILVEGVFDALSVPNGVATLHNSITKKQAFLLRNSEPFLLPDRQASKAIEVMKRYRWPLIVPNYTEKDSNEFDQKYGKLVLAKRLREGIYKNPIKAEVAYKTWRL